MRVPSYTGQFKRDVKSAEKRGKNMSKLRDVMSLLIEEQPLPRKLFDHALQGEWSKSRDLHIEPDWLLVYTLDGEVIRFERTGTHSDLFGK